MNKISALLSTNAKKTSYLFSALLIMLLITLACNLPFKIVWTGDEGTNQGPIEQDQSDLDDAQADSPAEDENDVEQDQIPPTETMSATPSPSPTITLTPTPEKVIAYLSKNTNCRLGPKDMYELIHIFKKGQYVELLGKNQEESFWYIQDDDGGTIKCWMWKKYTTPEGDTANLPVFTPPPSPVPVINFMLSYKQTTGKKIVLVYIQNIGNIALQSYSATFKDLDTSETNTVTGNKFGNAAKVSVGNTGVISSPEFSSSTIGHQIKATVKACTDDNQKGKCYTVTINFESK